MIVTIEILDKYDVCTEGKQWLLENAPNGIEILDALEYENLPKEFIFFSLKYLSLSSEEHAAAIKALNIDDSEDIWRSYNISSSYHIRDSYDVSNSENIWSSNNVEDSRKILNSYDISSCEDVKNSNHISFSQDIDASDNVGYSNSIYASSSISWSDFIISSLNIDGGQYCFLCKNSSLLTLCGVIEDCNNCCLCFGLTGQYNQLFNKQSNPRRVEQVRTEIAHILVNHTKKNKKLTNFFSDIPQELINYIKNLPEFDENTYKLLGL